MVPWAYIVCTAIGSGVIATFRYAPRAFLMIWGAMTKDPRRFRQIAEMLRLDHKDAKDIRSFVPQSSEATAPVKSDVSTRKWLPSCKWLRRRKQHEPKSLSADKS